MTPHKELLQKAVKIVGSQQKLANAIGKSQQGISYLMNAADIVSAEDALAISKATHGQIRPSEFRPDIFGDAA